MDAVEPQQMGWGFVGGCTSFSLPEHGGKIICFIIKGSFTHVIRLGCGVKMEQAARKFEVRVCDGTVGIVLGDEGGGHFLWPLDSVDNGLTLVDAFSG